MRYSVLSNTQNRVILKKASNTQKRVILKNRVAHDLLSIALYMCVKSESSGVSLHEASCLFRYMFLALKKNLNATLSHVLLTTGQCFVFSYDLGFRPGSLSKLLPTTIEVPVTVRDNPFVKEIPISHQYYFALRP